jgi:hypothetical protein
VAENQWLADSKVQRVSTSETVCSKVNTPEICLAVDVCVKAGKKKPQVPPLRFAPVGMTILWRNQFPFSHRIVIPTGAKRSGGTCGFLAGNEAGNA